METNTDQKNDDVVIEYVDSKLCHDNSSRGCFLTSIILLELLVIHICFFLL